MNKDWLENRAGVIKEYVNSAILQEQLCDIFDTFAPIRKDGKKLKVNYTADSDITPLEYLAMTFKNYMDSKNNETTIC